MASGKILSHSGISSYNPSFDGLEFKKNMSFVRCGQMIQVMGNGIYTNTAAGAWESVPIGTITDSRFLPKNDFSVAVANEGRDFFVNFSPNGSITVSDRSGVGMTNPQFVGSFTATYIAMNR